MSARTPPRSFGRMLATLALMGAVEILVRSSSVIEIAREIRHRFKPRR